MQTLKRYVPFAVIGLALGLAQAAQAGPKPDQIDRLTSDLTPMGSIRAGNAEGTIPEWAGGQTEWPEGYEPGMHHLDPFADDEVLFRIDASNYQQYADQLSVGQKAMFEHVYQADVIVDLLWHQSDELTEMTDIPGVYAFSVPSKVWPEQLKLVPPPGQMIKGELYGSQQDFENKRRLDSGFQQHNYPDSEGIQPNQPLYLGNRLYQNYWFQSVVPVQPRTWIEWGYPQYELLFLANQKAPYTLYWGNYQADKLSNDLLGLITQEQQSDPSLGAQVSLSWRTWVPVEKSPAFVFRITASSTL